MSPADLAATTGVLVILAIMLGALGAIVVIIIGEIRKGDRLAILMGIIVLALVLLIAGGWAGGQPFGG